MVSLSVFRGCIENESVSIDSPFVILAWVDKANGGRVTKPNREEAYCSLFVFQTRGQAKKIQDNVLTNKLEYDIDRSSVGTQSCNGRIPVKGMRTLYMGFENSQVSSNIYLWLEVLKVKTVTEYYIVKYRI